jgi:cytochrome b
MRRIRIWDLPTRLFHGLLLLTVSGSLLTPYLGETALPWHFCFGYATLTLLGFRLAWGLIGTQYARFASFVRSPRAIFSYMRGSSSGTEPPYPGHNPLGALSVIAMLCALIGQAATGLFSNDDIASQGPLAHLIDKALSDQISALHTAWGSKVIFALIGLHLLAVAYYQIGRRIDLVRPMITGDKVCADGAAAVVDKRPVRLRALACLLLSAALVWFAIQS